MIDRRRSHAILWVEAVGFLLIIGLSWANELWRLPHLVFGGTGRTDWRESAMETVVVLGVWAVTYRVTRRLVDRLVHVEGYLRLCAWCRRLGDEDGAWLPTEEYFAKHLDAKTTHGICPDCARKLLAE